METEHTNKPSNNEHVPEKREDGVSIPIISPHETEGPTLNSSPTPQAEENISSPPQDPSQMKSPPIQTMGPGYDPNRIPTSIFSTKPTNPAEWSVASNESLFSIHMGNNSFSRDYAILFGKSGDLQDWHGSELPRLDNPQTKPSDPVGLPPVMESPPHEERKKDNNCEIAEPGAKTEKKEKVNEASLTTSSSPPLEKHEKENPVHAEVVSISPVANRTDVKKATPTERTPSNPQTFPSPPRFSNDSGNSGSSFAFPVLVGEGGKTESLKVVPEHPEPPASEAQDSKETPNASETRWLDLVLTPTAKLKPQSICNVVLEEV
ncbi:hypothetical protein PHJA_001184700 [Phtheirospermum japonicum]|uniref:Uncharacterized protein n=1 Tax=Phtheirospermum japonicum TaxID=374723 RepID=A0A830BZH4_9LAMI|nr:hypothetical protein PHJA_001184700 [Phtheirospermum japonicum]